MNVLLNLIASLIESPKTIFDLCRENKETEESLFSHFSEIKKSDKFVFFEHENVYFLYTKFKAFPTINILKFFYEKGFTAFETHVLTKISLSHVQQEFSRLKKKNTYKKDNSVVLLSDIAKEFTFENVNILSVCEKYSISEKQLKGFFRIMKAKKIISKNWLKIGEFYCLQKKKEVLDFVPGKILPIVVGLHNRGFSNKEIGLEISRDLNHVTSLISYAKKKGHIKT